MGLVCSELRRQTLAAHVPFDSESARFLVGVSKVRLVQAELHS
jgi:hypothetical protein